MDIGQIAYRCFTTKHLYSLRPDVASYLSERILQSNVPSEKIPKLIEYIADQYSASMGNTVHIVERESLEDFVQKIFCDKIAYTSQVLQDPLDFVRLIPANGHGIWGSEEFHDLIVPNDANSKFSKERFILLKKRLLHSFPNNSIRNVGYLKGMDVNVSTYSFGMIQEFKENKFYLEDLEDAVELEISNSCFIDYTVCKAFFVLVKGSMNKRGAFQAEEIKSISPIELERHKKILPSIKFCSSESKTLNESNITEMIDGNIFLCFVNDPWLDLQVSKNRFLRLLKSFDSLSKVAIVILGQIFSPQSKHHDLASMKEISAMLANEKYPNFKFILVPSSDYPLFPQPPQISDDYAKTIAEISRFRLCYAPNPLKLSFLDQTLVAFDDSLCAQLYRNTLSRMGSQPSLSYDQCKREV